MRYRQIQKIALGFVFLVWFPMLERLRTYGAIAQSRMQRLSDLGRHGWQAQSYRAIFRAGHLHIDLSSVHMSFLPPAEV